ncbi:MAG: BLUF domain-containing protein, partial [Polynucleobacter victoriensis]
MTSYSLAQDAIFRRFTDRFSSFNPQELIELSYVSKSTTDVGILGLMNLLEDAVHKNKKLGVTGVLFYDSGIFGQILEGYPNCVEP